MGMCSAANLRKAIFYLKRNGFRKTWNAVRERLEGAGVPAYCYTPLSTSEEAAQRAASLEAEGKLTFSIVVPTYRTTEIYLRDMIKSVREQTYPGWELILADASGNNSVERVIRALQRDNPDERIRFHSLPDNAGIAQNTNAAIELARGEYIGLLDHDDVLTPDALYRMAEAIREAKRRGEEPRLLYSDEDKCDGDRIRYYEPNRKEDFNLDLLLSNNYICHFLVMESGLMKRLKLRAEYNGAQDYDLVLRAAAALDGHEEAIVHVPYVLYHWRCHLASTAENPQSKLYAYEAGRRAVEDFAGQRGWQVRVEHTEHLGFYRIVYLGDIFAMRPELGATGGPIVEGGRRVGGRMSETGEVFYRGLRASYSGYLHRAALQQDAEALDIRNLRVRKELKGLLSEAAEEAEGTKGLSAEAADGAESEKGLSAAEAGTESAADRAALAQSLAVSRRIRQAGYRLLYLPEQRQDR